MSQRIDYMDAQEIADSITGVENDDLDLTITDDAIYKKFDCSFESFHQIVEAVFQKMDFGLSPLTQKAYVGIAGDGMWHVKKEADQQFIAGLINWATEGEKIKKDSNGFLKEITSNGKVEYEIIIRHPKKQEQTKPTPA